jgi:hypothetical protein
VVDNIIPDILQPRKWLGKLLGNEGVVDNIIPDILQPRKWLGNLVNQVSPGAGNRQGGGEKGPLDDLVSAFKDGMQKVKEQVNQGAPQSAGNRQESGKKGPLDDLVSAFKDGMQKVKEQVNQAAPQRKGA